MSSQPPTPRLDRLEGFLAQDPHNARLLVDVFETALAAGAFERAEVPLRRALSDDGEHVAWRLREAHWWMARGRLDEADAALRALEGDPSLSAEARDACRSDRAHVDWQAGRWHEGIARLESWLDDAGASASDATEALWLRLLHHGQQHERALAWVRARIARGTPAPGALGVAGLIALDAGAYAEAKAWSEAALQVADAPAEALVARGTLALAERDAAGAERLLGEAVARKPNEGRAWSALGFARLLAHDAATARSDFERAVRLMPEHVGTWHGLGWAAIAGRDFAAARAAFQSALERDRNFADSHGGLAVAEALAGDVAAARASIERALRLDRTSLAARYAEALVAGEASDAAAVARLAERLLNGRAAPFGGSLWDSMKRDDLPRR